MKRAFKFLAIALIAVMAAGFAGCKHSHRYKVVDSKEPTCTEDGYRTSKCVECDEVLQEVLYAKGHTYNQYNTCVVCKHELNFTVKLAYLETEDGAGYNVAMGTTSATKIVIPAYNIDKPVLGVLPEGFANAVGENVAPTHAAEIESVEIPDGVTAIGERAFYGCVKLQTLTLPRLSLKTVGALAFRGCEKLETVNDSRGVESVGSNAFFGCTAMRKLPDMPALKTVGEYAFSGCTALETGYLGASVESVGAGVFANCTGLRFASLGTSPVIPRNAFENCTALEELNLSANLKEISSSAFSNCTNLKAIRFGGTMENWKSVVKANDWFLTGLEPGEFVNFFIYCTDGVLDHNGVITADAPN